MSTTCEEAVERFLHKSPEKKDAIAKEVSNESSDAMLQVMIYVDTGNK